MICLAIATMQSITHLWFHPTQPHTHAHTCTDCARATQDDAINSHLLAHAVPYTHKRFVAESSCKYFHPIAYPSPVDVGLRISKLGSSSATYDIGIFGDNDSNVLAARGHWVHVYVDSETGRPTPIAPVVRELLATLATPE